MKKISIAILSTLIMISFQNCGEKDSGVSSYLSTSEVTSGTDYDSFVAARGFISINDQAHLSLEMLSSKALADEGCEFSWERRSLSIDVDDGTVKLHLFVNEDFGGGYAATIEVPSNNGFAAGTREMTATCADFGISRDEFLRGGMYIQVVYSFSVDGEMYISSRPTAVRFENTSPESSQNPSNDENGDDDADATPALEQGRYYTTEGFTKRVLFYAAGGSVCDPQDSSKFVDVIEDDSAYNNILSKVFSFTGYKDCTDR